MKKRKLLAIIGGICLVLVLAIMPLMAACAEEAPPPVRPAERAGDTAIVVIDMQNDVWYDPALAAGWRAKAFADEHGTLENMQEALDICRANGVHVFYAVFAIRPELRPGVPYLIPGTEGAEIIKELKPKPGDIVFQKETFSCFNHTEFDYMLRYLGVTRLIIIGQMCQACILGTLVDAHDSAYESVILKDCLNTKSDELLNACLSIYPYWKAKVITTSELEDLLLHD